MKPDRRLKPWRSPRLAAKPMKTSPNHHHHACFSLQPPLLLTLPSPPHKKGTIFVSSFRNQSSMAEALEEHRECIPPSSLFFHGGSAEEWCSEELFPSLAWANVMFTKGGCYNVQVVVGENKPEEMLLGRFRREVMKAGVIQKSKRCRWFENS